MSKKYPVFPVGSVGYNLMLLRGTWHDHIELYNLDGTPLDDDSTAGSGSPGPGPFDHGEVDLAFLSRIRRPRSHGSRKIPGAGGSQAPGTS